MWSAINVLTHSLKVPDIVKRDVLQLSLSKINSNLG